MPAIKGFAPFLYEIDNKKELVQYCSPLFDVVDPAERHRLYRNQQNIIHLVNPEDPDPAHAKAKLDRWRSSGLVKQASQPSIYAYYQRYQHPSTAAPLVRKGFVALIHLPSQPVARHESTRSQAVAERRSFLQATQLQPSPTHGLINDPTGKLISLLDHSLGTPLEQLADSQGVTHELYRLAPEVANQVTEQVDNQHIVLADGHHRFAAAQQLAQDHPGTGAEWHMMYLTPQEDPGLLALPTHRLVRSALPEQAVLAKLEERFTLKPTDHLQPRQGPYEYVLLTAGGSYSLELKADLAEAQRQKTPRDQLDVSALHEHALAPTFGWPLDTLDQQPDLSYAKSLTEVQHELQSGRMSYAFLQDPVPLEQVRQVAVGGQLLPAKSTYFYPKAISGLIMYGW